MSERNQLTDQGNDKKYFILTPQVVWAHCRNPYDFTLWNVIKMVAGDNGECFLSTDDLAALAMMSPAQVSRSRKYLRDIGLIEGECRRDPGYPQPVWHVKIPDLWAENINWRQEHDSLKFRIEFKKEQKESLSHRKPFSQKEGGVSQKEGGVSQKTKNNHSDNQTDNLGAQSAKDDFSDIIPDQPPDPPKRRTPEEHKARIAAAIDDYHANNGQSLTTEQALLNAGWEIKRHDLKQAIIAFVDNTPFDIPSGDSERKGWIKYIDEHVKAFGLERLPQLYKDTYARLYEDQALPGGPWGFTKTMTALSAAQNYEKSKGSSKQPSDWTPEKARRMKELNRQLELEQRSQ